MPMINGINKPMAIQLSGLTAIDLIMSDNSDNPVANRVIKAYVDKSLFDKQDELFLNVKAFQADVDAKFECKKNMIDLSTLLIERRINEEAPLALEEFEGQSTTSRIEVKPNTSYCLSSVEGAPSVRISFDECDDKNIRTVTSILVVASIEGYVFTTGPYIKNIRLSAPSDMFEYLQLEEGTKPTPYESFTRTLKVEYLNESELKTSRQLKNLKRSLIEINKGNNSILVEPDLVLGLVKSTDGEMVDISLEYKSYRTNYIEIPSLTSKIEHNFTFSDDIDGYAFYNEDKKFISGGRDLGIIEVIPEDAEFFAITSYLEEGTHEGKNLKFYIK